MNPKPPSDMPAIRLVMMPKDTNAQGTIFGGVLLSLIDQAAFVEAWRQARHRYVTVAMDRVEFHQPVHVGDILSLWAETKKIGRTSLRVHVEVFAVRRDADTRVKVTEAEVVLVALDENDKPIAVLSGS
jgi:acyl-CoA thioesterase YciA